MWPQLKRNSAEVIALLLDANAEVDRPNGIGLAPLGFACHLGHLSIVQLLCSYGARRTFTQSPPLDTAESVATNNDHHHIASWLATRRLWSTALHYLELLTHSRALKLLRAGADVDAVARPGGPTPLSLAQAAEAAGGAAEGTTAHLILEAAKPWSRKTHKLFPEPARARAVQLMLIGERLSREERFVAYGPQAVVDAWMHLVVPKAVSRNHVQVVGLKGRPELNGKAGMIGEFNEAKGRYQLRLDSGEALLIKAVNLLSIGDESPPPPSSIEEQD